MHLLRATLVPILTACAVLASGACGSSPVGGGSAVDGGPADGGSPDGGTSPDGGLSDGGGGGPDGGALDGGPGDGGPGDGGSIGADGGTDLAPNRPCTDSVGDAYVTPPGLPPLTDAQRGVVVRCAPDTALSQTTVQARLAGAGVTGVTAATGISTYRIAFRTRRGDGSAGISSARVYLPTVPRAGPLPAVVITHGTVGLADLCAPSRYETVHDYLALPWAARGFPVIAPDYAGLGTEGVQGYGDNRDTGYSAIDGIRALRRLLRPGALSDQVVVAGHSQGGGAALAAQALARAYGPGALAAVVAFAPGWQYSVEAGALRFPALSTASAGGVPAAVAALALYAYHANRDGLDEAGAGFPDLTRAALVTAIESQCIVQLASSVPVIAPTVGALVEESLRSTYVACVDGTACVEPGKSYYDYGVANVLASDPAGGPVLVVQGMLDQQATPARTACIVAKMESEGLSPTVCTDALADHFSVVQRNSTHALAWVEAVLAGGPLPTCGASALPACN